MDFTFLKATGEVAFFRSDADRAEWTQEEMNLLCSFPINDKRIERGMVVLFQDPATNDWHAYAIRNCETYIAEGYQQFTAEDIAITELENVLIPDEIEITDKTAQQAINQLLSASTGSGWTVGRVEDTGTSSGNIMRGSAWRGVCTVRNNWNVHIQTRVTVNSGGITGRYIDILSASGTWRGLRLAVNKNMDDPCVTYDDSELYTALYGFGSSYSEGTGESRVTKETNFSGVTWAKTADHPAKPSGQKYLEWPEKTALYGINGRPRFGYFQNTGIRDANVLLQKTWESLKACCEPKISITGNMLDLTRLGYKDVPIRLYDMAIVELEPLGIQLYKQVIKNSVDLLNAAKTRPTIGDYIPNIIYINRDTEDIATGGSKGRGGGRGSTKTAKTDSHFETVIQQNQRDINIAARELDVHGNIINQAGMYIDPITGVLIYAEGKDNMIGSMFHVQKNMIESEVHARTQQGAQLSSRITQTANQISLEVSERKSADAGLSGRIDVQANRISLVVEGTGANAHIKPAEIVASINDGASTIKLSANHIDIDGLVNKMVAYNVEVASLETRNTATFGGEVTFTEGADFSDTDVTGIVNLYAESGTFGDISVEDSGGTSRTVSWKSFTNRYVNLSTERAFLWGSTSGISGSTTGRIAISYTDTTIYYLGR
jgi:phage minor structural protein